MVSASSVNVNGRGTPTSVPPISTSVIQEPVANIWGAGGPFSYVMYTAGAADSIPAWGTAPAARDRSLREFWHTEPILAGAVGTTTSRYGAFNYKLDGPDRLVRMYEEMFESSQQGKGWLQLIIPTILDLITQDNGAFIEVVRSEDNPAAPVVTLNHLDAGRCIRTGRLDTPVVYFDLWGKYHLLKWYDVIPLTLLPSPVEEMRGMQYSILTLILRAAQIMRDISIYQREKVSGRFTRAIHLVGGVQTSVITDAITKHQAQADGQGLLRYILPVVVGSLDPTARVSHEQIDLASLPDGFDPEKQFRQYITELALAFGTDYQEFAPLATGNLGGGSANSETLHLKARGKGPRLFMTTIETALNYHGVLPRNVTFSYADQDTGEDIDKTKLGLLRAEDRAMRIKSGELTPEIAVRLAVDAGDLPKEYADELIAQLKKSAEDELKLQQQQLAAKRTSGGNDTARDGGMKSPRAPQVDRAKG